MSVARCRVDLEIECWHYQDESDLDPENTLFRRRGSLLRRVASQPLILALIERTQFAQNKKIYAAGEFPSTNFPGSWLDWFLFETESFHGECYCCCPL